MRQAARNRNHAAPHRRPLRETARQGAAPENLAVLQCPRRGGYRGKGRGSFDLRSAADAATRARRRARLPPAASHHARAEHDTLAGNYSQAHRAAASRARRRRRQIHRPAGRLQISLRGDHPRRRRQRLRRGNRAGGFRGNRKERRGKNVEGTWRNSCSGRVRRARHRGKNSGGAIRARK